MARVLITIVGYRNADDIADCLRALSAIRVEPSFEVFIAENGGDAGMDALTARLDPDSTAWRGDDDAESSIDPPTPCRRRKYRFVRPNGELGAKIQVAQMTENLGYAGGINFWLR